MYQWKQGFDKYARSKKPMKGGEKMSEHKFQIVEIYGKIGENPPERTVHIRRMAFVSCVWVG